MILNSLVFFGFPQRLAQDDLHLKSLNIHVKVYQTQTMNLLNDFTLPLLMNPLIGVIQSKINTADLYIKQVDVGFESETPL